MQSIKSKPWCAKKLNELGFIGRGKSRHRPRNDPSLYGGEYPFIQTGEIKAANMYVSEYSQTYNDKGLAQSKLWNEGTLCITIAANIAETAILKIKGCFPDSIVGFVPYPEQSNVHFVKYYIDYLKLQMQNISQGTTQDNLSVEKLLSFDFIVPEVEIQHKIAAILSAYDDLIENNQRRIAILEELARNLYREWFVHFRFPGHEQAAFRETELGRVPEGWKMENLGSVPLNFNSKRKPLSSLERADMKGPYPYYGAAKIFDYINNFIFTGKYLLVAEDGSVITPDGKPVLQVTNGQFWVNNHAHILQGKPPVSTNYLYLALSEVSISGYITGAAQPKITQANLNRIPVCVPSINLLEMFDGVVDSLFLQIQNLKNKNANLRQTRDLLLPRLVSGEIDVAELEIAGVAELV